MLLNLHKGKVIKIKFFKSLWESLFLSLFLAFYPAGITFGFKEVQPFGFLDGVKSKIKVKVNYLEGPSQAGFFTNTELDKYIDLGPFENLEDAWLGKYSLIQESIFWTNPNLNKYKIFNLIGFGQYDISLKFNLASDNRLSCLEIFQEGVKYGSVNIELPNNKQINYWTKATSSSWIEIIRGKIMRVNDEELFTEFQTTVYEERTPIYAFHGQSVLRRIEKR